MIARNRVATIFAMVSTTCLLSASAGNAQLNNSWTSVPGYIDVQGRMTTVEKSIFEALAAGRLTPAQADQFGAALNQIKAQDTSFRADGKLNMWERVKLIMDLDKLNQQIQGSLTDRKVAITDVSGHEADIERTIQEALLSGRLNSLEASNFRRSLSDIRDKEAALKADGALSSQDLLSLSMDLDKLSQNIEQSLRARVIGDPGIETKKADAKKRIDSLVATGRINVQQADLLNQQLNNIIAQQNMFQASGNLIDANENLALAMELEKLKVQIDRFQPDTIPTTTKSIDQQQAEISQAINDAKLSGKLSVQDANDLSQEYSRIEALESMFRADNQLSNNEVLTLNRDLEGLRKRVTDTTSKAQVPTLEQRKQTLRQKITDAQAAGRIKPESLGADFLSEMDRIEAKDRFYRADGSLNDTETLLIANDLDALSTKVESSLSALPNAAQQKDQIEKRLNEALASGRLDPSKADEIRQELQRIAFLDSTFRGNDGILDDRELSALNREYTNLQTKLDKQMPALPDIDTLQADVEKRLNAGISNGSINSSNADSLKREFDRIANVESSFRSSDNSLAEWETMALKRDLDRLSSDIDRIASSGPVKVNIDTAGASADTKGHWAQDYIAILQQRGTIGGFPDGTFKPDQGITRSQFAAIAVKALGLPAGGREVEFRDLPKAHWAYKAICSASDAGLVGGFPDGSFRPEDKLTRAQALVILAKALNKGSNDTTALDKYKDGTGVAAWAAPSVAKAASAGIVVNYPDPFQIRPSDLATRAEVAALTYQTMANLGQKLPPLRIGLEACAN